MKNNLLCDELDDIVHSYDYGIVPGSATIFVRDELSGIIRLDMTLLEGVMIVIEISSQEYRVCSCLPLSNTNIALTTVQSIQKLIETPFESMDNLLLAISPMFRDKFQKLLFDKLESVHQNDVCTSQGEFLSSSLNSYSTQASVVSEVSQSIPRNGLEDIQGWINRI